MVNCVFGEGPYSVLLSEGLTNLVMILSEEQWESHETSFRNLYEQMEPVIKENEECLLHIVFVIFCLWVPLNDESKHGVVQSARKKCGDLPSYQVKANLSILNV